MGALNNIKEQEIRDDADALSNQLSNVLELDYHDSISAYDLIYNYLYKKYDEDS